MGAAAADANPNDDAPKANVFARLKAYGLGGVLAYGVFNTLYYVVAFLVAVAAGVRTDAFSATSAASIAKTLSAILVAVWAGSQALKLPRALAALACAPLANRLLDAAAGRLPAAWPDARKRTAAFAALCAACWSLFALAFGVGYYAVASAAA